MNVNLKRIGVILMTALEETNLKYLIEQFYKFCSFPQGKCLIQDVDIFVLYCPGKRNNSGVILDKKI